MNIGVRRLASAATIASGLLLVGSAAEADCYDILGCSDKDIFSKHFDYLGSVEDGPNCEFLKGMRDGITAQSGTSLSKIEKANMATIRRAESLKHCPP